MSLINKYKIFSSFLNKSQKGEFYFIVVLLFFQSLLEVVGVGIVIPIVSTLLDPNSFSKYFDLHQVFNSYVLNKNYIIFIILFFVLLFFFFKNYFLYFVIKKSYNFAFKVQCLIRNNLYNNYIAKSYKDYSETDSAKFISDISVNISLFTQYFTIPILILSAEILVIISILIFLFLVIQDGFLILFFFLLVGIIVGYKFISKTLKNIGEQKEESEKRLVKVLNNSIGSIKVTKIFGLEKKYSEDFAKYNDLIGSVQSKHGIYSNLPRLALEFLSLLSICILISLLFLIGKTNNEIIIILALFSAAGFKILPSLNRIILSAQGMKYSSSVMENIAKIYLSQKFVTANKVFEETKIDFNSLLELKNINYSYEGYKIINNLNLILKKNLKIGIFGKSGVGKTTLLDIFAGLIFPTGDILVDNKKIHLNQQSWNNIISYVPQFNYIIEGTLLENIALGNLDKKNIDIKKIEKLIDLLYLRDDLLKTRDEGINLFLGEKGINLSGGQIQRIGIARALYKDSKILLMDEPTSSLEPENEKRVVNLICSMKDLTVIIVSHKKNTLNQCDEIYEFINGKLVLFKKI